MQNRVEPDATWSDAELVRTYQAGTNEAWDILYSRHQRKIRDFSFYKGIKNSEDLDDLVQEIFLEAMEKIDELRDPEKFIRWLYRIATGTVSTWLRKEDKRREVQESLGIVNNLLETGEFYVAISQEPERKAINKEHLKIAFSLIEQLPPSEKEAFWLYLDGMKNIEIAEKLGIKVGAVNVRVYKAKKKLRAWLEAEYPEVLADLVNRGII